MSSIKITEGLPWWLSGNEPTSIHEEMGLKPGLTRWVEDLALPWLRLWLWCRQAAASLIGLLSWESPDTAGVALKSKKKKKKKKEKKEKKLTFPQKKTSNSVRNE